MYILEQQRQGDVLLRENQAFDQSLGPSCQDAGGDELLQGALAFNLRNVGVPRAGPCTSTTPLHPHLISNHKNMRAPANRSLHDFPCFIHGVC